MLSQNGKVAEYRNHIIKYPRRVVNCSDHYSKIEGRFYYTSWQKR